MADYNIVRQHENRRLYSVLRTRREHENWRRQWDSLQREATFNIKWPTRSPEANSLIYANELCIAKLERKNCLQEAVLYCAHTTIFFFSFILIPLLCGDDVR